jgi:poly-gamma-glutamate capsule biosynthesis protein CapA/YwtB (metallophosphatase superfamily)
MLVSPWSKADDDATLRLFYAMREAEVTILNLEIVIHSFEGYAQANSGGSWMRSPPEIARELTWAGVDMVANANNHSFDYGSEGILQTIRHAEEAGLVISGSGRLPSGFDTDHRAGLRDCEGFATV